MRKVLLFSFVVAFCVDVCVTSGKEGSGNDVAIAQPDVSNFIPVDNAELKGLYGIGSELEFSRADVNCSEEKPCRNGGTCSNGECRCSSETSGVLCEEILNCSRCVNKFEVDCLFDKSLMSNYCQCKNTTLYYDYTRDICIPCPCENGWCTTEITRFTRKLKCSCMSGYKEFMGYCKECSCGTGGVCQFDLDGNKICNCTEGFYEREGQCNRCLCGSGIEKCKVIGTEKICTCRYGYQNVLGHCEDIDECETNPKICPSFAVCRNRPGDYVCECPEGYELFYIYDSTRNITMKDDPDNPGYICADIDECRKKLNACYPSRSTTCVNLPGSYKCECKPGFEPYGYNVEPHNTFCLETKKSWGPAVIVIVTTCGLLAISYFMHVCVKKRASRLN